MNDNKIETVSKEIVIVFNLGVTDLELSQFKNEIYRSLPTEILNKIKDVKIEIWEG
jgi:hypothetical protein